MTSLSSTGTEKAIGVVNASKESVLQVYPRMAVVEVEDDWWVVFDDSAKIAKAVRIGCGMTEDAALDDAASKLPHPEPPSPDGEIASESEPVYVDAAGICRCKSRFMGTITHPNPDCPIHHGKSVPEPVPAEGAPLGTCTDFPTTPHPEGTCESCVMWKPIAQPSAPEAAAAGTIIGTWPGNETDAELLGKLREIRTSAAPIAPADESTATSERLLRAINWAMGCGPDDFRSVRHDAPRFWWRSELAERAGLEYDGEKYVIRPTPPVREQP